MKSVAEPAPCRILFAPAADFLDASFDQFRDVGENFLPNKMFAFESGGRHLFMHMEQLVRLPQKPGTKNRGTK